MGRLEGKTAVITGATSGIGEATALLFAKEGAKVVLAGRNQEKGLQNVKAIEEAGGEAIFVPTDVRKQQDIKTMVDLAMQRFGRIDILVNNAGIMINKYFKDYTLDDFNAIMETNYRAYLFTMWEILPIMQKQGGGSVINVASILYAKANPGQSLYSAFKAAVNQTTRCLAQEYGKDNIRLNTICPGPILTNMMPKEALENKEAMQAIADTVPLGRVGLPQEIAYLAVFLASDESSFVNGASYVADGGIL